MKTKKKKERIESGQTDGNEFARFDELTRHLMSVPKKEIDEKAKEYEAEKAKETSRKAKVA